MPPVYLIGNKLTPYVFRQKKVCRIFLNFGLNLPSINFNRSIKTDWFNKLFYYFSGRKTVHLCQSVYFFAPSVPGQVQCNRGNTGQASQELSPGICICI